MHIVESGLVIAVIAGLAIGIGLVIVFAVHFQPTLVTKQTSTPIPLPDRPDEVSSEEWEVAVDATAAALFTAAKADPEVKAMAKDAYNNQNYDFMPAEFSDSGLDEVTIHLVMEQEVKGDWQTGYSITWSRISDVIMSYDKGILISKKIIRLPDHTAEYTYNDEDKAIIKAALEDRQVTELIANNHIYVSNIRKSVGFYDPAINCPMGHCASVSVTEARTRETFVVAVNTDTMEAVQTLLAEGWSIS